MDYDRFSEGKSVVAMASTSLTTAVTTKSAIIIDTLGFGALTVGISATVTTGTISAVGFEEGENSSLTDATAVDEKFLLYYPTQFPVSATGVIRVGYVGKKRYVKLNVTTASTTTVGIVVFAMAELGHGQAQPSEVTSSVLEKSDILAPGQVADSVVTSPKRT
jgi:hypothetical protein